MSNLSKTFNSPSISHQTKYTLLDEADIKLVQQYAFEAKLEVDANGMGACVYAYAYDIKRGRPSGQYVHTMLW